MNSLTVNNRLPQLRNSRIWDLVVSVCAWYQAAGFHVTTVGAGDCGCLASEGEALCENLTGVSETTEVSRPRHQMGARDSTRYIPREGYDHECFSPLEQFQRKFTELKDDHEH
jgi:hypothetical protein